MVPYMTSALNQQLVAAIWAPHAWLAHGWQANVLLRIDANGCWSEVTSDIAKPPADAKVLTGPLLPGFVNAHSHAFQRAFAGLAERRETQTDTFWSWREHMYQVARAMTPEQLRSIAIQLYGELLQGGYTQVCEFHYLQNDPSGKPYNDPLEMTWALVDAAETVGIGITILPTLYERAGFTTSDVNSEQRRFRSTAESVWDACQYINCARRPLVNAGIAAHSLRGVTPNGLRKLQELINQWQGPIHIHVAEQVGEVKDCIAATGKRPISWLAENGLLDHRWNLVHATHTTPEEIEAIAESGATLILCPSTEANLGDGIPDVVGFLEQGIPMAIGSDSHVTRDWREELRWLEYAQRLQKRARNVCAAPQMGWSSTAEHLFTNMLAGGGAACGHDPWGLKIGARADALVVNSSNVKGTELPLKSLLDSLVFSSPSVPWKATMVAGEWRK